MLLKCICVVNTEITDYYSKRSEVNDPFVTFLSPAFTNNLVRAMRHRSGANRVLEMYLRRKYCEIATGYYF